MGTVQVPEMKTIYPVPGSAARTKFQGHADPLETTALQGICGNGDQFLFMDCPDKIALEAHDAPFPDRLYKTGHILQITGFKKREKIVRTLPGIMKGSAGLP